MTIDSSCVPKHFSLRGEWVEMCFMARAAEHEIRAIKPWGNCSRYDFVVEWHGRFRRVQVKSTTYRRYRAYTCTLSTSSHRMYTKEEVDFFAVFVIPEVAWYIIPIGAVAHVSRSLNFRPHSSECLYEQYREAWHLLRGEQSQTQGPSTSLGITGLLPGDRT